MSSSDEASEEETSDFEITSDDEDEGEVSNWNTADLDDIEKAFRIFDVDGDMHIDHEEFKLMCYALGQPMTDDEARLALNDIDVGEEDGRISPEEFANWWNGHTGSGGEHSIALRAKLRAQLMDRKARRAIRKSFNSKNLMPSVNPIKAKMNVQFGDGSNIKKSAMQANVTYKKNKKGYSANADTVKCGYEISFSVNKKAGSAKLKSFSTDANKRIKAITKDFPPSSSVQYNIKKKGGSIIVSLTMNVPNDYEMKNLMKTLDLLHIVDAKGTAKLSQAPADPSQASTSKKAAKVKDEDRLQGSVEGSLKMNEHGIKFLHKEKTYYRESKREMHKILLQSFVTSDFVIDNRFEDVNAIVQRMGDAFSAAAAGDETKRNESRMFAMWATDLLATGNVWGALADDDLIAAGMKKAFVELKREAEMNDESNGLLGDMEDFVYDLRECLIGVDEVSVTVGNVNVNAKCKNANFAYVIPSREKVASAGDIEAMLEQRMNKDTPKHEAAETTEEETEDDSESYY